MSIISIRNTVDKILRTSIFFFFISIFILALLAPIIQHLKGYPSGENIYSFFSSVCHQYPTRCLWVFNLPTALCSRCCFLYFGLSISPLVFRSEKRYLSRLLFGLFLIIIASIDPILQLLKLYESNNYLRVFTGFIGGVGTFFVIYPFKYRRE